MTAFPLPSWLPFHLSAYAAFPLPVAFVYLAVTFPHHKQPERPQLLLRKRRSERSSYRYTAPPANETLYNVQEGPRPHCGRPPAGTGTTLFCHGFSHIRRPLCNIFSWPPPPNAEACVDRRRRWRSASGSSGTSREGFAGE